MSRAKSYLCENFGKCPLADKQERIHFDEDDKFQCESKEHLECPAKDPKCRENLIEVRSRKGLGLPLPVTAAAAALAALLAVAASFGSCGKSTPAAKEKAIAAELKKIWPWLAP